MKTSLILGLCVICGIVNALGQAATLSGQGTSVNALPAPTPYHLVGQGPNHNVWQRETFERGPDGAIHTHVQKYTEVASGLNFWNGAWAPSAELIEPFTGGAVAKQGPCQVIFANNLNSPGAIDHLTPQGQRLRSSVLGLAYRDQATGQTVMIAAVQDSTGQLIANNQVLYPNAFAGVKCDVRYTYTRSSFEQEIILREQPPAHG